MTTAGAAPVPTMPPAADLAITRPAIVALVLLSLINMLNYFDRIIITVLAQPVKEHFGLSDTQLGVLTGPAFVGVYMVTSVIFGWLVDRRSRRTVLVCVLLLWSVMTAASSVARSYAQLAVARAGVGIGEGGASPACWSMLGDYFPLRRRSTAAAIFNAIGMVGLLLGFLAGGWVADRYGWRTAFLLAGVPGLLLAPVLWLFLREPRRGAMDAIPHVTLSYRATLAALVRNRPYVWIVAATAISTFGNLGMIQWLPLFFIRSHALSVLDVGFYFGPTLVLGLISGMLLGGWLGDRLARRSIGSMLWLSVGATLTMLPLYWLVLWAPSVEIALGLTFVATAISVLHASSGVAVVQTVLPAAMRGTGIAIYNLLHTLVGQGLLPLLVGILSDALAVRYGPESLRIALTLCIASAGMAGLLFVRARTVTIRTFSGRDAQTT